MTRMLHPLAWWGWALGIAVAASRTTNPLLLLGLALVLTTVVLARRSDGPWAGAFRLYLILAAVVVTVRVLFRLIFGGGLGEAVLVPLPQLVIPVGPAEVTLLGDVTAEALLSGLYDGLRLGVIILAVGAANTLVNPRRLLRSLPAALHEVSTALVVAVSVFPQLAESVTRVRAARRLRPVDAEGRVERVRAVFVPGARGRPGPVPAAGGVDGLPRLRPQRRPDRRRLPGGRHPARRRPLRGVRRAVRRARRDHPTGACDPDAGRRCRRRAARGVALRPRRTADGVPPRPLAPRRDLDRALRSGDGGRWCWPTTSCCTRRSARRRGLRCRC